MTEHCFNVRDVGFDQGNIQPMLVQCEPLVSDTDPTLGERLVFAGLYHIAAVKKCYVEPAVPPLLGYGVKGSGPALNQCWHREHVFAGFYLLISPPLIPYTLGAFSQRWGNVLKRT